MRPSISILRTRMSCDGLAYTRGPSILCAWVGEDQHSVYAYELRPTLSAVWKPNFIQQSVYACESRPRQQSWVYADSWLSTNLPRFYPKVCTWSYLLSTSVLRQGHKELVSIPACFTVSIDVCVSKYERPEILWVLKVRTWAIFMCNMASYCWTRVSSLRGAVLCVLAYGLIVSSRIKSFYCSLFSAEEGF